MNRLNSKGQSLAIFVIFVPVFIMIGTLVVDVSFARYNVRKLDNINNARFACDDASNFLLTKSYDCVFVDPPRKGLDNKVIKALINSHPKKIIYISCDVSTLARDLNILKNYFNIDSIDFVDMFPRTFHVETVCALSFKK